MKTPKVATGGIQQVKVTVFDAHRYPAKKRKPQRHANAEVYLSPITVEFFSFDEAYLRRLEQRDPGTEEHFVQYFTAILVSKLRTRSLSTQDVDELKQETFSRVVRAITQREVHEPQRFGAFVAAVCHNVLLEFYRSRRRDQHMDVDEVEVPDGETNLESDIIRKEQQREVRAILARMPAKDQAILRALYIDEIDKEEICQRFKVKRDYFRVKLHRALKNFRALYPPGPKPPSGNGRARRKGAS